MRFLQKTIHLFLYKGKPFRIESQYISPYIEEKTEQNKIKSAPNWVRIEKNTIPLSGNKEKNRGAAKVIYNLNTKQTFSNDLTIAFHNVNK